MTPPMKLEVHSLRILVLAPIGRDGPASAELLRRGGLGAETCPDIETLVRELDAGAGAVFIAEEALYGAAAAALTAWAQRQPPWSDLPFVVATSKQDQPSVTGWRQRLIENLSNVSLLERPVQAITLVSAMRTALRARQRQYEVRAHLNERERTAQALEEEVAARTAELRAQIEERERIEETLRQTQKIEAIGQLTGGVAHDFNNLLMVITGGLNILDSQPDPARRRRLMDGMRQAAARGAGLTKQLLAFSRSQPLRPEPIDLARQIGAMRELLDRSLRGDVHVLTTFADHLWATEVDPGELELVVLNLAVNARDAMAGGGVVSIHAENAPALDQGDLKGDFVRLSIADTGVGMSAEVIERAFEPFYTTKDIGKGSGLGLAQVHGFAAQSGGGVRIDSAPGEGTVVSLFLPRSRRTPAAAEAPPPEFHGAHSAARGHVLVVEDDEDVAALVIEMIRQLGFETTRVSSAQAALGALADGRPIDLMFSDVMMPGGMNGLDLAREARRRRPDLPILLTSGYADAAIREAEAQGVPLLPKPYQLQTLATAVDGALAGMER
jgi:signal transduction histidine kinase/CheY-like chemotaxis protein